MITANSRYYGSGVTVLPNKTSLVRRMFPIPVHEVWYHTWTSSDRLDLLAARAYGDPRLWYLILDHNPQILNPSAIKVGDQIRVPVPDSKIGEVRNGANA